MDEDDPSVSQPELAEADDDVPEIFPYHPLSSTLKESGHWPNLSPQHQQALHELKQLLVERGYDISRWALGEPEELMLLRFLRAKRFAVSGAFDMLSKDIDWRVEHGVDQLRLLSGEEVRAARVSRAFAPGASRRVSPRPSRGRTLASSSSSSSCLLYTSPSPRD